ncbi:MAG: amidohydrolase family protein [Bifidobacteriaceae bacterium]|nr:amidohydrolase family protein [Bifidobacteriaceae bacterium]
MIHDPLYAAAHPTPLENVTVYTAPLIIPITGPIIINGAIAVSRGKIVHVGTRAWVLDALKLDMAENATVNELYWKGIITPGLINAHTHLQYTNMASVGKGQYTSFNDWSKAFNKVYDHPENLSSWKESAEDGAKQLVQNGTTAAADIVTDPEAATALASQSMHGIAYWEVMDWHNDNWKETGVLDLVSHLGAMNATDLPSIGISPHAPYSLETSPFVDLPDIARQLDIRLHIHLAETPMEAGNPNESLTTFSSTQWRDKDWKSYQQLKQAGMDASAIQFLDQLGSLGPDVHIAHGVWANSEDRRILRQRGVGVALCPRSNRITVTGKDAPIRQYLEEGNLLAIGTDSLSSSPSLDVLEDAALVYEIARSQGYTNADLSHRVIRMLTLGGAETLGMHVGPGRIGQINAGATADLAFFDIQVDTSSPQSIEKTLDYFITNGAGSNRATVISGKLVYNKAFSS